MTLHMDSLQLEEDRGVIGKLYFVTSLTTYVIVKIRVKAA